MNIHWRPIRNVKKQRAWRGLALLLAVLMLLGSFPINGWAIEHEEQTSIEQSIVPLSVPLVSGAFGGASGASWILYDDGTVIVDAGNVNWGGMSSPWAEYQSIVAVERVVFTGPITTGPSLFSLFRDLTTVHTIEGLEYFNTGGVTNMQGVFQNTPALTTLSDLSGWDTSSATSMNSMFMDSGLASVSVSSWDTGNVTDMRYMFREMHNLTSLDLSGWNTSNVTAMPRMFQGTRALTSIGDTSNWDTGRVTNMQSMFQNTPLLTNIDAVSYWDVGRVTNMNAMFMNSGMASLDLSNWNTSNVTNMGFLFADMPHLTSLNVAGWDTGSATNTGTMFRNSLLTEIDLSGWDTRSVTAMANMFQNANALRVLTLGPDWVATAQNLALRAVPSTSPYTGRWQNVAGGTIDNPQGTLAYTSPALMTDNNGAGNTWVWELEVQEYTVTFLPGANGTLTGETTLTVPHGTVLVADDIPTPVPNTGWVFDGWLPSEPLGHTVTAPITFTAQWRVAEHMVTFLPGANGTLTGETILTVPHGTVLTADDIPTPVPNAGWVFDGWLPSEPLGHAVTAPITFTAQWRVAEHVVTFLPGTNGTLTGETTLTVPHGTVLTADDIPTPVPNMGWVFDGWLPSEPLGHTVTAPITFTAQWRIAEHTVTFLPGANGTLTGEATLTVPHGTVLTADDIPTPVPNTGWVFDGWLPSEPLGHTVMAPITFTAQWRVAEHVVTFLPGTNGTLTGETILTVPHGTELTADDIPTPVPDTGWVFDGWLPSEPLGHTVTAPITFTAQWRVAEHTVTFLPGPNGTLTGETILTVPHGTELTADDIPTPTPNTGWVFDGWLPSEPLGHTVTAPITFTAQWRVAEHTVTFLPGANGTLTGEATLTVPHGTVLTADDIPTPVPDTGWVFDGWLSSEPLGHTVTAPITFTAQWRVAEHVVTFLPGTNGTLTGETTLTVPHGTELTAGDIPTPVPNTGWVFDGWLPSEPLGHVVTAPITFTAQWRVAEHVVTFLPGTNGTLTGETTLTVPHGTVLTADDIPTPTPNTGWVFDGWLPSEPLGHTVTAPITFTAQWRVAEHTVTFLPGTNGTLTGETALAVPHGTVLTADDIPTPVPDTGWVFDGWLPSEPLGHTVTAPITFTAQWRVAEHVVTFLPGPNGTLTGETTLTVPHGTELTADDIPTPVPNTGWVFDGWLPSEPLGHTVTAPITFTAQWRVAEHVVTFLPGPNGTLTGEAILTVPHGTELVADDIPTPVPNMGWVFDGWLPSEPLGHTVTAPITFTAQWRVVEHTVTFLPGANGTLTGETTLTVPHGTELTADDIPTPVPNTGWVFDGWLPSEPLGHVVTAPITFTAQWRVAEHVVTFLPGTNGTLTDETTLTVSHGTELTADDIPTPVPNTGWVFDGWLPSEPLGHTVTAPITFTAQWRVAAYIVTFLPGPNGTLTGETTLTVPHGTELTAADIPTPVPDTGWVFDGWLPSEPLGHTVTASITFTAQWRVAEVLPVRSRQAYLVGTDAGLVQPKAHITRAEVATIFFRLIDDDMRTANWSQTNPYPDVVLARWFNNAVSTMTELGVFIGFPDGTFAPNQPITRAELTVAVTRFMDVAGISYTGENLFSDIHGHWASASINAAAAQDWVQGPYGRGGAFYPDQLITRAETAAIINRIFERLPETPEDLLPEMLQWPDNADVDAWYYLYIQSATNSYSYERKADGVHERWLALVPVRNWPVLERPTSRPGDIA